MKLRHKSAAPPSFTERFRNINWNDFTPIDCDKPLKAEDDIYEQLNTLKKQVTRLIAENKSLSSYKDKYYILKQKQS